MEFNIKFRPLRTGDARFINDLRNIESMERMLGGYLRPVSYERDVKWIEDLIMKDDQSLVYFAVTPHDSEEIIGYTSVAGINYKSGSCIYGGIKLDEKHSGKGLGKQVTLKVLRYAFEELRMERCEGECLESNTAALRMMQYAGFVKEGLKRNSLYKNGCHNNQWLLSVVSEEYAIIKQKFNL